MAKNGIKGELELPLATLYNTSKIVTARHVSLASQIHYIIAICTRQMLAAPCKGRT